MEFLSGLFLGYLLFFKNKNISGASYGGTRTVKCTVPLYKKPPRNE